MVLHGERTENFCTRGGGENLRLTSRLEPRFIPRSRGRWKKVKDFFYPRGAIKEKERVSNELRKMCEESAMFKPDFVKQYWV